MPSGVNAQTTISTNFANNNGNASITFNFQNTNPYPVIIKEIGSVVGTSSTVTAQVWYHPNPVNSATTPPPATVANGWTQFGTGTFTGITNTTTNTAQPFLTNLNLTVPPGATYGIVVGVNASLRYSTIAAGTYTFSGGGCNLITGTNMGWAGPAIPGAYTFNNRGFIGYVKFVIGLPPCSGAPDPGTVIASDTALCPGYDITLVDTSHTKGQFNLSWSWQQSYTSGNTWTNVPNSAGKDTMVLPFSNTVWYRLRMVCSNTNDTTYSNVAKVNLKPPYKCYCYSIATGARNDTSDITAFSIGDLVVNTGGPHIDNPDARRGRTDYTDIGPSIIYADSVYTVRIYHTLNRHFHGDARVTLFMDFNNNLRYDLPQEAIYLTSTTPQTNWISTANNWFLVNDVKIPKAVVPNVPTGMRVILNNDIAPNTPSDEACGPYVSGETEDYTIMFREKASGIGGVITSLQDLYIYPNPSSGMFSISFSAAEQVADLLITITDITGRTVETSRINNVYGATLHQVDMSSEPRGVYFVTVSADGQKQTHKLVLR